MKLEDKYKPRYTMKSIAFLSALILISFNAHSTDNGGKLNVDGLKFNMDPMSPVIHDSITTATYHQYYQFSAEHRKKVFEWQLWSSRIIFWVVLSITFIGVIFSIIQFIKQPSASNKETELILSLSQINLKTSIIGVTILALSLAFLFLYLAYVYPITES